VVVDCWECCVWCQSKKKFHSQYHSKPSYWWTCRGLFF
jgi:hypothetical protein